MTSFGGNASVRAKKALTLLQVMGLGISVMIGFIASGGPAGAATGVGSPTAATLPEVVMTCVSGQTDINKATVAELMVALAVDKPVATRVVSWRPYLQTKDLLVVEGIGPQKLAAILAANKTCATPTQYPLPARNPCVDTTHVDLAAASVDEMAKRLGITKPIAQRIAVGRPYASLGHVTPERVGGVGKGTLDTVVSKSCLTPAPVRSADSSWRWAYSSQKTMVTRDKYALTVPARVIDTAGGWASITPIDNSVTDTTPAGPLVTGDQPTADFHIHAPWTGGGDTVTVRLPADPALASNPDWIPFLIHTKDDGRVETFHDATAAWNQAAGTVSAAQTSLSDTSSSSYAPSWLLEKALGVLFGIRTTDPTCAQAWAQQPGSAWFEDPNYRHLAYLDSYMLNLPGKPSLLGSYPFKHCLQSIGGDGSDVRLKLRNNTGSIEVVKPLGGSSIAKEPDGALIDADLYGLLVTTVAEKLDPGAKYLTPGATAYFDTPLSTERDVDASPDRVATAIYYFLKEGLEPVTDKVLGGKQMSATTFGMLNNAVDCMSTLLGSLGGSVDDTILALPRTGEKCVKPEELIASMRADLSAAMRAGVKGIDYGQAFDNLKKADRFLLWFKATDIALKAVDTIAWSGLPDTSVRVAHWPAKPTFDSHGFPVREECLTQDFATHTWTLNEACQSIAWHNATTPPSGSGVPGTDYPPAVIVRKSSGNELYVYNSSGGPGTWYQIRTGANYVCLAKHYMVDWVQNNREYYADNVIHLNDFPCNDADPAAYDTNPSVVDEFTLLREPDSEGAPNRVWRVLDRSAGKRTEVPTGNEFYCLTDPPTTDIGQIILNPIPYLVWDQVPVHTINALAPTIITPYPDAGANCATGF